MICRQSVTLRFDAERGYFRGLCTCGAMCTSDRPPPAAPAAAPPEAAMNGRDLYDELADRHTDEIAVALELIVVDLARCGALPRSPAEQAGLLVHLVRVLQNMLVTGYIASQKDFLAEAREGVHPLDPQPDSAAPAASPTSDSDAK